MSNTANENVCNNWIDCRKGLALKDQKYFAGYVTLVGKVAKPGDRLLEISCGSGTSVEALRCAAYIIAGLIKIIFWRVEYVA